jgi:hypothetical protein
MTEQTVTAVGFKVIINSDMSMLLFIYLLIYKYLFCLGSLEMFVASRSNEQTGPRNTLITSIHLDKATNVRPCSLSQLPRDIATLEEDAQGITTLACVTYLNFSFYLKLFLNLKSIK